MLARMKGILQWLVLFIILISLTGVSSLYSQFLEDAEEKKEKIIEEKELIPDNIALHIKAHSTPGASGQECTIRVSWDLNPKYLTGDYVVARSNQVIDTVDKVRAAQVIYTVKASAKNVVVDLDCTPGSYYYVVLSKKSIIDNKIELFEGINYTATPVLIDASGPLLMISKIKAEEIENFRVRLTWQKVDKTGALYTVYRSEQSINTGSRLKEAEKLTTAVDIGEYVDDKISASGTYYYAVTVKALNGKDNPSLVPDANFTVKGLPINIKEKEEKKSIKPDDIDRILKKTFFKGNYRGAIKALQDLLNNSDNKEVAAKGKLFIGRSYIELGRYQKALDYLILSDVKKYYPKEADFWLEFALTRIKNY